MFVRGEKFVLRDVVRVYSVEGEFLSQVQKTHAHLAKDYVEDVSEKPLWWFSVLRAEKVMLVYLVS